MQDVPNPDAAARSPPQPAEPAQPSQPAQPTVPPAEAPQSPPDVDVPSPGTGSPGSDDGQPSAQARIAAAGR